MKEVISINAKRVDLQTISILEELLESAKAGMLESIIFVDKYTDGKVGSGWAGKPCKKMIGELEDVKFNYLSQLYFPIILDQE